MTNRTTNVILLKVVTLFRSANCQNIFKWNNCFQGNAARLGYWAEFAQNLWGSKNTRKCFTWRIRQRSLCIQPCSQPVCEMSPTNNVAVVQPIVESTHNRQRYVGCHDPITKCFYNLSPVKRYRNVSTINFIKREVLWSGKIVHNWAVSRKTYAFTDTMYNGMSGSGFRATLPDISTESCLHLMPTYRRVLVWYQLSITMVCLTSNRLVTNVLRLTWLWAVGWKLQWQNTCHEV